MAIKVTKVEEKVQYDKKLCRLLDEYSQVLIAVADNMGSNQLQKIRQGLRGDSVVLIGKNTLIRRCIRIHAENSDNKEYLNLLPLSSRFGTWHAAMLTQSKSKAILEGPVCNGSQVIGWQTNEKSKRLRRFHIDMSGFAFNSTILWDPKKWHRPTGDLIVQLDTVKEGFQHYGTHRIGFLFAPIIIMWMLFISGIGVHNIFKWNVHVCNKHRHQTMEVTW